MLSQLGAEVSVPACVGCRSSTTSGSAGSVLPAESELRASVELVVPRSMPQAVKVLGDVEKFNFISVSHADLYLYRSNDVVKRA